MSHDRRLFRRAATGLFSLVLIADLSANAQAEPPNVSGVWHKNHDPKASLKLLLKQDGAILKGNFYNGNTKWPVEGVISENGAIQMFRWFPSSELPADTTKAERKYLETSVGDKTRPGFLIGPVTLQYNRDGSISGEYMRYGVSDTTVNTENVKIKLGQFLEPLLSGKNTRFHRLFIIGKGKNNNENREFSLAANRLVAALGIRSENWNKIFAGYNHGRPGTDPDKSKILKRIRAMRSMADKPGDQILIYYVGHGWTDARGRGMSEQYEWEFRKFVKSWKEALVKAYGKVTYDNTKIYHFYLKAIHDGKIKKTNNVEIFKEFLWIHDRNGDDSNGDDESIYDYEFAEALKSIVDDKIPLTLIMDTCYGSGISDNFGKSANVKVIGVGSSCPGSYGNKSAITRVIVDLLKSNTTKDNVIIRSQSGIDALEKHYPGLVGPPFDDLRDIPLNIRKVKLDSGSSGCPSGRCGSRN